MIVERRKDARIAHFSSGEYGCPERDRTLYKTQHTQHALHGTQHNNTTIGRRN